VLDLAGLRIQLPEELERLFREAAMKRFGYGRGSISQAAQEAIRKWLGAELQLEKSEFDLRVIPSKQLRDCWLMLKSIQ